MSKRNLDKISQLYKLELAREASKLESFKEAIRPGLIISGLASINLTKFLYTCFVKTQVSHSKSHIALSAMLLQYYRDLFSEKDMVLIQPICYAILSDYEALILVYTKMDVPESQEDFAANYVRFIQKLLTGDLSGRVQCLAEMDKLAKSGWERHYKGMIRAFRGLDKLDAKEVKEGIEDFLKVHDKCEESPLLRGLLSMEAVMALKLAARLGVEVKIENPLVPNNLVVVDEAKDYYWYPVMEEWARKKGF